MTVVNLRLRTFLACLLLVAGACRQQQISPADLRLELTASDALVGETTLLATVMDAEGKPITTRGTLNVRGDMRHAGRVPVFAEAAPGSAGVYSLPFEWTMAGSWLVEASLKLPNGDVAAQTFTFEILPEADAEDMPGGDHSGMDQPPGEASAVYMTISNRGETDQVIVSAASAAANQIDFHRTVVEDDIARMETLDALVIPAGETLELRPGGAHIMLSALREDLPLNGQFRLQLTSSAGAVYDLSVSIADMRMLDLHDAVEIGDLTFSQRWARPARAGGMTHDDMPMNAEQDDSS